MLLQAVNLIYEILIALVARQLIRLIQDSDDQEVFILVVGVQHYRFMSFWWELVDIIPIAQVNSRGVLLVHIDGSRFMLDSDIGV